MIHDIEIAHRHSAGHRAELQFSTRCGCFYCGSIFEPAAINEWVDQGQTALCPHCDVDAVLGEEAGVPLTDDFLRRMHKHWFGATEDTAR